MQVQCACGAKADPIEGMITQDEATGAMVQHWSCAAGHRFGTVVTKVHQCPRCSHKWGELVQGGAPSFERLAHGQRPEHGVNGIEQLGFDDVMRYDS